MRVRFRGLSTDTDLAMLVSELAEVLPGLRMTGEDFYAARKKETEKVLAEMWERGQRDPRYHRHIVDSLDRVAAEAGRTEGAALTLENGTVLTGAISHKGLLLRCDIPIMGRATELLESRLRSFSFVADVRISDAFAPWKRGRK
jgi:hypothetical protein